MKRPQKKSKKGQVKRSPIHQSFVHKAHTGKLVHKSNTHYPALAFLMLLCGILMLCVTFTVSAASINVKATVLGEPPATAATIDIPKNNQHFKAIPIDVAGSCPLESYVRIYRNDVFAGSVVCSATGDYSLKIDLFVGKNTLVAHVYNNANVEGPVSGNVVVFYDKPINKPPVAPKPVSTGSAQPANPISQLYISSDIIYKGFYANQEISWPIEIGGGKAPYAVSVDWGDGNRDVYSLKAAGNFIVKHTYAKPGGIRGSYNVSIQASDDQGQKAYLQIVLLINNLKIATTGTIQSGECDPSSVSLTSSAKNAYSNVLIPTDCNEVLSQWQHLFNFILMLWPFYILATLMLTSFWLGERREFNMLLGKHRIRKAH